MNSSQRILLRAMAAIEGLMVLFPPWQVIAHDRALASGYGFLLELPRYSENLVARLDLGTLSAQMIGVLIVGGLIFLSLSGDRPGR